MKLKYLGTGAAEGIPALFCDCDVCAFAKKNLGKDLRTRSQAVIDDKLLIDFPPDTFMHSIYNGLDLSEIHHCIVTHNHSDHLYPEDLVMRMNDYATLKNDLSFTLYASVNSSKNIQAILDENAQINRGRVSLETIMPFMPYYIDGYTITPLEADHERICDPYIYLISKDNKTILYANDTGYFPESTWQYIHQNKIKLDLLSIDCTAMNLTGWDSGHMSIDTINTVRKRLTEYGNVKNDSVWIYNHFSHNGGLNHQELAEIADEFDFLVSYDGMEIEI